MRLIATRAGQRQLPTWVGADKQVFVAEEACAILGTYYIRPNQAGGGRLSMHNRRLPYPPQEDIVKACPSRTNTHLIPLSPIA